MEDSHFFQTVMAPVQRVEGEKEDIRSSRRLSVVFQRVEVGREARDTVGLGVDWGVTMDRRSVGQGSQS